MNNSGGGSDSSDKSHEDPYGLKFSLHNIAKPLLLGVIVGGTHLLTVTLLKKWWNTPVEIKTPKTLGN